MKSAKRLRTHGNRAKAKPRRKPAGASRPAVPLRSFKPAKSKKKYSPNEIAALEDQLREARETLDAIMSGGVEAVVVRGPRGNMIYTLTGAEQPYRIYVEQMQEGAVTVSADGIILYANRHFANMIEAPLERVIGSSLLDHLSADAWAKISPVFTRNERVVKYESVLQDISGHTRVVNLTASQIPLVEQNVMCLVITDLTAQKEKEELRLAKEIAEKANESKDHFLAALSHELRTPLTPVLMMASTMEEDPSIPRSLRKNLGMIRLNVELEARLIDDLLDLTRVTHGKLEMHNEALDLHEVLKRAVHICQTQMVDKHHDFQVRAQAAKIDSFGDPVRLQQALWNLIRNAIKFTPVGGSITVTTGNPRPDWFSVEVKDTGIGFDQRLAPRLFEAFEQGSKEITRQFGGLGLGLVISHSIVEAHGGQLSADSPGPGKGATFTLELPLVQPPAAELGPDAAPPQITNNIRKKFCWWKTMPTLEPASNICCVKTNTKSTAPVPLVKPWPWLPATNSTLSSATWVCPTKADSPS